MRLKKKNQKAEEDQKAVNLKRKIKKELLEELLADLQKDSWTDAYHEKPDTDVDKKIFEKDIDKLKQKLKDNEERFTELKPKDNDVIAGKSGEITIALWNEDVEKVQKKHKKSGFNKKFGVDGYYD